MYNLIPQKQHETSACSSESGQSPLQFYAMNSIYELQSVINQLNIEKQKERISYANELHQYQVQIRELGERMKILIHQKEQYKKQVDHWKGQAIGWKNKAQQTKRQRNQFEKQLKLLQKKANEIDLKPYMANYQKTKVILDQKLAEIEKLQLKLRQAQRKQLQTRALNNELKTNFSQQISILNDKLNEQHLKHRQQIKKLTISHEEQKQKLNQMVTKFRSKANQLAIDKQDLSNKLAQCRKNIHEIHVNYIQSQAISAKSKTQTLFRRENEYKKLSDQYNELLQQKNMIAADFAVEKKKMENIQEQCISYLKQIQTLQATLSLKNQTELNIEKILKQKQSEPVFKQPNNQLAQSQEMIYQLQKKNRQLQSLNQSLNHKCANLQQKLSQQLIEKAALQQKLDNQRHFMNEIENRNQNYKSQMSNLKIELMEMKTQLQIVLKQKNDLQIKNQKILINNSLNADIGCFNKYNELLEGITASNKEKTTLMRENTALKSELKRVQDEIILKLKQKSQLQLQVDEDKRKYIKIQAQKQQYVKKIQILEEQIAKSERNFNEEKKEWMRKMEIMNQCMGNIKKERKNMRYSLNDKRPLSCDKRVIQLKIRPPSVQSLPAKNEQEVKVPAQDTIERKIQQKLHNFEARKFLIPTKQKMDLSNSISAHEIGLKSYNKKPIKQNNLNLSDQKLKNELIIGLKKKAKIQMSYKNLNQKIQHLKKQNKELSMEKQY